MDKVRTPHEHPSKNKSHIKVNIFSNSLQADNIGASRGSKMSSGDRSSDPEFTIEPHDYNAFQSDNDTNAYRTGIGE